MKEEDKNRLMQLGQMAAQGLFGEEVKFSHKEYEGLSTELDIFLKIVDDFYNSKDDPEIFKLKDLLCQLIIVVYRDSKTTDQEVSNGLLFSFINDFPETKNTCLLSRIDTLLKVSVGFKMSPKQPLLVWQQAISVVQAYNEFLNGLLGYLLVGWRTALGKSYSKKIFQNSYGSKLNEFSELTNGENGAFYLIFRIANPKLRNAIAHSNIWLDQKTNIVRYKDGKNEFKNYEMRLEDFMILTLVGSHLPDIYITAISSIAIKELGKHTEFEKLPKHLQKLFNNRRK